MYCVRCGEKAEKGQKICIGCGMRLISPEALLKLLKKHDLEKKIARMEFDRKEKEAKDDAFVKGYMDRLSSKEEKPSVRAAQKQTLENAKKKKSSDEREKASSKAGQSLRTEKSAVKPEEKKHKRPDSIVLDISQSSKKTARRADDEYNEKTAKKEAKDASSRRVTPLFDNPTQPKRRSIFDDANEERKPEKPKQASGGGSARSAGKRDKEEKNAGADKRKTEKPKTSEKKKSNPVVRLPEKKKPSDGPKKNAGRNERRLTDQYYIPERKDKAGRTGNGKTGDRVKSDRTSVKRPDRTHPAGSKSRQPSHKTKSSGTARGGGSRPAREEDTFAEKHLRSIISMVLLACTVVFVLMWGYTTESGLRTMAEFGLGSSRGYVLLGDDCMEGGNYKRAVEHYYKALSKKVNYEAGIKLSRAYQKTGETEKETSALLLLMDHYSSEQEPYNRILELYPYPDQRPEPVRAAISMHENGSR